MGSKPQQPVDAWLTQERILVLMLAAVTAFVCVLGFWLVLPFVPAITWALVLAVITYPLHRLCTEPSRWGLCKERWAASCSGGLDCPHRCCGAP